MPIHCLSQGVPSSGSLSFLQGTSKSQHGDKLLHFYYYYHITIEPKI